MGELRELASSPETLVNNRPNMRISCTFKTASTAASSTNVHKNDNLLG